MKALIDLWKPSKLIFIILNISISFLGLLRTIIFLDFMDFRELGMVSVFQTIILLIALSQIGILNGAYRAYAGTRKIYIKSINNFTFTFFLALAVACIPIIVLYIVLQPSAVWVVLCLGVVAGILSLMTNYLTNSLLAESRIKEVNIINIISNLLGFASLLLIYVDPILGLLSFIIQPLSFVLLTLLIKPAYVPRRVFFSGNILQHLLKLGFIPYLTGLFVYLNVQFERWTIVSALGVEALGHYYLAISYAAFFALFPNSINSLYFPRMVRAHAEGNTLMYDKLFRNYAIILFLYCAFAALLTFAFATEVIGIFFKEHLGNLQYVYLTVPGLVAITIAGPYIVYFNSSLNLRPLLFAYVASTFVIVIAMIYLYWINSITLFNVAIADSLGNITISVIAIFVFYRLQSRTITKLNA